MSGGSKSRGRVLFIVNEFYFFYSHRLPLAQAVAREGWEVHVAAPSTSGWAPGFFDPEVLAEDGFILHTIPLDRQSRNLFKEFRTFGAILSLIRRVRPHLLLLYTVKPVLYGGVAARLVPVPGVVLSVTGMGRVFTATSVGGRLIRWMVTLVYGVALRHRNSRIIVQNVEDGRRLVAIGAAKPDRIHLIRGSGVNLAAFAPHSEPSGPPLVILASRLIWEKGVGEFVEAARNLRGKGVDARFAILGNTLRENPHSIPEDKLRAWHEDGIVEWLGRVEDMAGAYAQSSVVCLPSRYGEGVPKGLIEAAAAGRPVVTTDTPGCNDIVRDGVNGYLVPVGDVPALAAAIESLLVDPELRRRMGEAGRRRAEDGFGIEAVVGQTLDVLEEVQKSGEPFLF